MIVCDSIVKCSDSATNTFFFFNDTATTEIYTLSLHDALPILATTTLDGTFSLVYLVFNTIMNLTSQDAQVACFRNRSEEHTSELQSQSNLVCRLLLEKKNSDLFAD